MQYFTKDVDFALYLRLTKTSWNKAYAFIFGCDNKQQQVLSETIYAYYDPNSAQIMYSAEGNLKQMWVTDQTDAGSNVNLPLSQFSQGIVLWYGFEGVGVV